MARLIVLLRGINVGRGRVLKMADVRAQCEAAGARAVATYIQSGNIACDHARPAALGAELETRLAKVAGFAVPVMVRTAAEWARLIADNPFADNVDHLHLLCLPAKPAADALATLDHAALAPERCALGTREVYLHLPGGMGNSKLAVAVSRVKALAGATARNWRTVLALRDLAA